MDNDSWSAIEKGLNRTNKKDLVELIQQLSFISPDVKRFLQTRYLKPKSIKSRVSQYSKTIKEQFVISEWNSTVTWNFSSVQKAIDDYAISSHGDAGGLAELYVFALETAVSFADSINLQADDFDEEITHLAERCTEHFQGQPHLISTYKNRIKKAINKGNHVGFYAMTDYLDELAHPIG